MSIPMPMPSAIVQTPHAVRPTPPVCSDFNNLQMGAAAPPNPTDPTNLYVYHLPPDADDTLLYKISTKICYQYLFDNRTYSLRLARFKA